MKNKNVLIIEDDKEINDLLCNVLSEAGYVPKSAFNGLDGIKFASTEPYQVILLDVMLPYKNGEDVLRRIRDRYNTPVIVISAKDMTHTKIDFLRLGADDYITKPFDIDEVVARIEAVLRRYDNTTTKYNLSYRDIVIDYESKRVTVAGNDVALTVTEYAILELFIKNPTKIFSKRNLFESINGEEYLNDDNTINVHISNIRHKLREARKSETYIETVYGMGYRLVKN